MSGHQSHNGVSSVDGVNQLIMPNEIKQELEVKEEPMADGDMVELSPIINERIGQSSGNPSRCSVEGVANFLCHEVKSEVKQESTERKKKKEGARASGRNDGALDNPRGQQALGQAACNAKKSINSNAKGNSSKQHQCDQCGYATKYKPNLEKHLLKHTGEKPFPCTHCPKEFTRKHYLQNHMKMHVEEFLFICKVCLQGFDEKDQKLAHEKECRIRRYECHLCKQSFGSMKVDLIRHIRIHSGAKPFECTECSKKFIQKGHLKSHMQLHAGPCSFHCSRCRSGFVQQNEMVAHEQKCSRRLYECYVCGKFIGLIKENLQYHMRTHTSDKPFPCSQCARKFKLKCALTRHMKLYSRSLPWKCATCRQGFPNQNQCERHQRSCSRRV